MDTVLFSVRAILPMLVTIIIGMVFSAAIKWDKGFYRQLNAFTFHLLFPLNLFYSVLTIPDAADINWRALVFLASSAVLSIGVGIVAVKAFKVEPLRKNVIIQATFRANVATVALALVPAIGGENEAISAAFASLAFGAVLPEEEKQRQRGDDQCGHPFKEAYPQHISLIDGRPYHKGQLGGSLHLKAGFLAGGHTREPADRNGGRKRGNGSVQHRKDFLAAKPRAKEQDEQHARQSAVQRIAAFIQMKVSGETVGKGGVPEPAIADSGEDESGRNRGQHRQQSCGSIFPLNLPQQTVEQRSDQESASDQKTEPINLEKTEIQKNKMTVQNRFLRYPASDNLSASGRAVAKYRMSLKARSPPSETLLKSLS